MGSAVKLGLPYKGSKRKLAAGIVDFILDENLDCKYVYDLFGGGGAVSLEFASREQIKKVYYNDMHKGVSKLFKNLLTKDKLPKKYYKFVRREKFHKLKTKPTAYGGFVSLCYSFGNDGRSYLFGRRIEEDKELLHNIVVYKDKKLKNYGNIQMPEGSSIKERYANIKKNIKNRRGELQNIESIQNIERIVNIESSLKSKIKVKNSSYQEVKIKTKKEETVIYLDPPYKNTNKYAHDICHAELLSYITNSGYKCYVSSYDYEGLKCIKEFHHNSSMGCSSNKKVTERLFVNG